ncbi:hypothetical protein [Dysgonomonas macrotermitis]|uniref:SIR2-like domain-containing protein n=1 Tax=Dysgonomonas macrotermitis TaxID=1346286 RepID=A0A1M5HX37_9BACT|nr:hypothetical protein [Dysgonomonas macrotermitis]SHG20430.1 SIR2-like domain-containing protein [Dysgonomonas macrotermitis]
MDDLNFYQGNTNLLKNIKEGSDGLTLQDIQLKEIRNRLAEFFNIKNIHFLLGSGTSCNAIPNMKGLFREVLKTQINKKNSIPKNEYHEEIWREFKSIHKRSRDKGNLEEILGILYSNRIYLDNYTDKERELKICAELIKSIECIIFNKINIGFDSEEAKKVLLSYQTFYQKLALRNKDLSRLNIFTTNNDLFNETALDSLNIHYINGFGGGINKFFNPALFNYSFSKRMDTSIEKYEPVENMVNLYKIHGSVNWMEDGSNSNTFFKIREISYPEKLVIQRN